MDASEVPNKIAQAHAKHKMHLQAIGEMVVRQLVKHGAIDADKLECAALDLRLVDVDANNKFTALPITIK